MDESAEKIIGGFFLHHDIAAVQDHRRDREDNQTRKDEMRKRIRSTNMIYLDYSGFVPVLFNGTKKKDLGFDDYSIVKIFRYEDREVTAPVLGIGEEGYFASYILIRLHGSPMVIYKTYRVIQRIGDQLILEPSKYCPDYLKPVEIEEEAFWS